MVKKYYGLRDLTQKILFSCFKISRSMVKIMKPNKISFTADINKPQAPVSKAVNSENMENSKHSETDNKNGKMLLFATLGGLALGGIYLVARAKRSKVKLDIFELTPETLKKYRCRFKKGKLLLPDKSGFSGQFIQNLKDGGKIVREYKDGIIQKSAKFLNDEKVWSKEYIGGRIGIIDRPMETVIYPRALETVPPKSLPSHVA